ncbi:helix-turn-helix transcriptional regulator [uncultured Nisaea sp.]|jgi:transcriptional regulator with XRE-family HTH domain|uniref:helix-turn-helix domain-containing protein n=1 Tax=uncultured Nisaea sp. TaxID=538215 RepID=UPI0030EDA8E4|tara:strand:+ start:128 stop:670 length:543 start_codon:yes stop_codon:yes gene_type:complete
MKNAANRLVDDLSEDSTLATDKDVADRGKSSTSNNPVDVFVGARLRRRRKEMGMTQRIVAQKIGVTSQQYMKYERGDNRISASRLFDVASVLNTPVSFFFDEMDEQTIAQSPARLLGGEGMAPPMVSTHDVEIDSPLARRQASELVRLWCDLPEHARTRIVDLVRTMSELADPGQDNDRS